MNETVTPSQYFKNSVFASLLVALIALSFKDYFLFRPFQTGVNTLTVLGFLSMIGWILLVVVPPLMFASRLKTWTFAKSLILIATTSIWTLSTLLIKLYGLFTVGQLWASYLVVYPILIFVEWILPIYYIAVAVRLAKSRI